MRLASRWSHVGCYFLPGRIVVSPGSCHSGLLVFKEGGGGLYLFIFFYYYYYVGGEGIWLGIFNM